MKKYVVAALALAIVVGASAVAQNLNELEVKEVKISGIERVSEQAVRSQLEVQPGQKYNPAAVARDIRRLYDLGHFESVQVDAQPVEGGVALTYIVQEKRIIDQINIIGNNKMRASRIRGVLSCRQGDSFSPDLYDEERRAVLSLYEQRGFANTTVDINVEEIGASRVRITYDIKEGRRARIRDIDFIGNQALSHRRLRKALGIRPAFLFFGGKYNEEKLETGLDNIVDTYGNVGHLEAQIVSTDINYTPSGKRMELDITVAEGPQYKVDTLEVANNVVFDDDELVKVVEVRPGDVHNKGQVAEDASLIEKGYQDAGYVNATVTPQVTLDREQHTTHVVHRVQEQDLKYLNEIEITGNTVTRDDVIRRQLLIAPGDRYDGTAIKLSEQRLQGTRYFDAVRITLHDLEDYDQYSDLLVDVEEGKTNNFNFGAGYSTDEGISGFAELKFTNFDIGNWPRFSGGGQIFSARIQLGETTSRYSISFTDPEILGQPLAFGFDIFDESYKYRRESDYTEDTRGGQIRFGKMLSPFVTARTSFRYVDVDYSEFGWRWLYTPTWRREMQPSTTIANTWSIERDSTFNSADAATGSRHILAGTVGGFGGDNEFLKLEHESKWYFPIRKDNRLVLSYRTSEGLVVPYGSSDWVPISERFFAGGSSTVRGYESRDIGPRARRMWLFDDKKEPIGGELRLLNNVELRYKLTDIFRLYTFVDAGGVWKETGDFDLGGIKYSAGIGFGADVPRLGPVRVDYAVPINPEDYQGSGRLHLSTGFSF